MWVTLLLVSYKTTVGRGYRTEVLDCYVFGSLQVVRGMSVDWLHRYNYRRPYEALGKILPDYDHIKLFSQPLLLIDSGD